MASYRGRGGGRGGGRGFGGGGRGFRGGGRGGFRGGRGGGRFQYDTGPPEFVVGEYDTARGDFILLRVLEIGSFIHPCENDLVCRGTNEKIPYFNAPLYLENKAQIGKVDDIFGAINEYVSFVECC